MGEDLEKRKEIVFRQAEKINYVNHQFGIAKTINHLHKMMIEVTSREINAANVNAACHCVSKLNETIEVAIKAAKFLNTED